MSDPAAFLVITAIPKPDKMDQLQTYLSQALPILMQGGGQPVGRYRTREQLLGDGGPMFTAILEFPSSAAIKEVLAGDAFNGLNELRAEIFHSIDLMDCASL